MIKNYIRMNIDTNLTQDVIIELAKNTFSEFEWRQGDSDMMGYYLSGVNQKGVKIKIWFGEIPYDMAVSFSTENEGVKEQLKISIMDKINNIFIPQIKALTN